MRKPHLQRIDIKILEAKAFGYFEIWKKRYIDAGGKLRTLQHRIKKLKKIGLLEHDGSVSQHCFPFLGRVKSSLAKIPVVISHGYRFKCHTSNPPTDRWLRSNGWRRLRFMREKRHGVQYVYRKVVVGIQLTGSTLQIYVPRVFGDCPQANGVEAARIANETAEELRKRGWSLSEPIPVQHSHHVLPGMKSLAETVFRNTGRIEIDGIIVDNSCKDGGEFEIHGEEKAKEMLAAISKLPATERKVYEHDSRISTIEAVLRLNTDSLKRANPSDIHDIFETDSSKPT